MNFRRETRVLGLATGVLALASAAYQAAGEARDRRRYRPPGRLVDVGGRRLHIRVSGDAEPAVVIIPALGGDVADWLTVQDGLASRTTVCVYDRPGQGWSDPGGWPAAAGMARELHALLDDAAIPLPFLIAGHSMGGLVARVFTEFYRDEVAGLVLIDSSHPEQDARLPRVQLRDYPGGKLAEVAQDFASPLGVRRLTRTLRGKRPGDASAAIALSSRHRRASAKELLALDAVCRQTGRIASRDLGNLPLAVITSSKRDPRLPEGSKAQRQRSRFYPGWSQLQDELAGLSANSVHVTAANAGHQVQRDDPELVIKTIAGLVLRVREA